MANICTTEVDHFLSPIHCVHEFYFKVDHDVLTFGLCLGPFPSLFSTEHSLKLIEYVTEWLTLPTLLSSKLLREALKASESLPTAERIGTTEWVLPTKRILGLLIARHARLIVDAPLAFIAQRLVRIVDLGELFFGLFTRVDVRMIFLRELEVRLLDIRLGGVSIEAQQAVVVFVISSSATAATASPTSSCERAL